MAIKDVIIGYVKGPKGDKGDKGNIGATGAIGPTGPQGPLPPLIANYLATAAGQGALDAYMGKLIDQRLTELSNGLTALNGEMKEQTFKFSANKAGLTQSDLRCVKIGKVCYVCGIFTPNQSGTPLNLGSFPILPKYTATFGINGYDRIASYGSVGTDGIFACNIPNLMVDSYCAVSFFYITE